MVLAGAPSASAATYKPNKLGDHAPGKCNATDCTLREAVIKANGHAGSDRIVLVGGKVYSLTRPGPGEEESVPAKGDLDVTDSLKIKSSNPKLATIDANRHDRIIDAGISGPVEITLRRLRLRGGQAPSYSSGGGVQLRDGSMRIVNSLVVGNRARGGGGVNVFCCLASNLAIVRSTIRNNRARTVEGFPGSGGGINIGDPDKFIGEPNETTITASTIHDNRATGSGGGIENRGNLVVNNSTIANNSANGDGGGVFSSEDVLLESVTVARNLAGADNAGDDFGGGLLVSDGGFALRNSIVALNDVGTDSFHPDCSASTAHHFNTLEVNLFTDIEGCTGASEPPDIVTAAPKLGLLAANDGPTKTLELKRGSPAINAAGAGSPARDQRGKKRNNPDIGAFERKRGD
jgi:hypothetical protein